ncbi:hypothetical protein MTO96_044191 [Rhipicephalus appendiculatus]
MLRRLILTVINPSLAANTAPLSCWTFLFESLSANTSIAHVDIRSQGNFEYNDHLARTIGHSRSITRVIFRLNAAGNAHEFVFHLSAALGENYNFLKMNFSVNVGFEAKHSWFRFRKTVRRNTCLLERAAACNDIDHLDR